MAEAFHCGRRGVALQAVHGKADRLVRAQAARDVLDPGAPEIWTADQPASRWLKVLGPPVDSLAHQEAKDSNSVWEPQALQLQVASQQQRASLRRRAAPWQALEKLDGARVQALLLAAWRQPRALVAPLQARLAAQVHAALPRPDLAGEKSSQAQQAEQPRALK